MSDTDSQPQLPPNFPKVNAQKDAKVLMVCLGNICRSPTLDIVMRKFAQERKLNITVDSAGTANYHEGENPHPPSIKHAKSRGYDMSKLISRQINQNDFEEFDLILTADKSNYKNVIRIAPKEYHSKIIPATNFLPKNSKYYGLDYIVDPWGGPSSEYQQVIDMSEDIVGNLCDIIDKYSAE